VIAALLLLGAAVQAAAGPGSARAPVVTLSTIPAVPLRGTVATLVVRPGDSSDAPLDIEGQAADEPLHFEPSGRGYRAIAGIPLEGPDSLQVTLRVIHRNAVDTIRTSLAIATPHYPNERLTVAPKYAVLDSATQARVDAEVEQARAVGRAAHETTRLWTTFSVPRPSKVRSVFGAGREFNGEVTSRHYGTDFAGTIGAPVRAAARGVVALVANFYLAGHAVYLSHGGGLVTGYFHLSRVDVEEGDTVARGRIIGGVGRSGRATGPHLHWIARYGAMTVDPMSLLRLKAEGSRLKAESR
jgi:murein DD-endopeptidase MepM/ murein hydrolase activator NlpD